MKRVLTRLTSAFDASDIPVAIFFFGLALLGYGLTQIHRGLGLAVVGLFLICYARPLSGLIR